MLNKVQAFSMPANAIYATKQKEVKSKEDVATVNNNGNVLKNNLNALASLGRSQVAIKFGYDELLLDAMGSALKFYKNQEYDDAKKCYLKIIKKLETNNNDNLNSSDKSFYTNFLSKSYYMLGKVYKEKGEHAKAREAFEKSAEYLKENLSLNPVNGFEDTVHQGISRARIFLLQAYNEIDEIKKTAEENPNISKGHPAYQFGECYDFDYLGRDNSFKIIGSALGLKKKDLDEIISKYTDALGE